MNTKAFFNDKNYHAFTALEKAHFLSFAPYAFQASLCLRDFGILDFLLQHQDGVQFEDIKPNRTLSHYALRVLVEAGIGIGLIIEENGTYFITKTGILFITDKMVRVNTDFMQDICYEGAFKLKESLLHGKPEGLPFLGPWNTIYEGLSKLDAKKTKSWFDFDNFYSDHVFALALPIVFKNNPKTILDIGANTGKFSIHCMQYNQDVQMHLLDYAGQLAMAEKNMQEKNLDRYQLIPHNILNQQTAIPGQYDVIWMSQFLDCFSDEEIKQILIKCKAALNPNGRIFINETFWDQQAHHAAMYSLQMTSLYFTTQANGNSQMYDSRIFIKLIEEVGLTIKQVNHGIATTHSLIEISL
ncbi:MAG: class I SAM-dependent methyltransferase [Chitinophagaceae bacterium]